MVSFVALLQAIYDELKVVVQNNTSVSTPDDHVGVLDRIEDIETPFFGFEWTLNPDALGIGGNVRNGQITTDASGDIDSVEKLRDYELMIDFAVVVDGDYPRERDGYLGNVQTHFSNYVDYPSDLHSDVRRVREVGAFQSGGGDGRDIGFRATYSINFHTSGSISVPPASTVDWDVDSDSTDAYPEKY